MANIPSPEKLEGKYVKLREVRMDDAEFIVKLRTNTSRNKFLHPTSSDVSKQVEYLKKYFEENNTWYFIIENKKGEPIGTIRIYNVDFPRFTGGSWLMLEGTDPRESIEADLLLSRYGFEVLGFEESYFDVEVGNNKVINYNKLVGAIIIEKNNNNVKFYINKEAYLTNKKKFFSRI